jgi:hypothetical protein
MKPMRIGVLQKRSLLITMELLLQKLVVLPLWLIMHQLRQVLQELSMIKVSFHKEDLIMLLLLVTGQHLLAQLPLPLMV